MTYSGTKGETPDTDKAAPSGLPGQLSTLPRTGRAFKFINIMNVQKDKELSLEEKYIEKIRMY